MRLLFKNEANLARVTLEKKPDLISITDVLVSLTPLKEAFPTLTRLVQIALTIGVSTAHCERSFLSLKRIKTCLRNTMAEQRLTDLAVLSVEREISSRLNLDEVLKEFTRLHGNHRIVLS